MDPIGAFISSRAFPLSAVLSSGCNGGSSSSPEVSYPGNRDRIRHNMQNITNMHNKMNRNEYVRMPGSVDQPRKLVVNMYQCTVYKLI